MVRYIFLLMFFFTGHGLFANAPVAETREAMAVRLINDQMKRNAALIKIGAISETRYIVDARGKWWTEGIDNISEADLDVANEQLQIVNQQSGLVFYTLLSSPFINPKEFIIKNSDGSVSIFRNGAIETFPASESEEYQQQLRNLQYQIEEEFTMKVAEKSNIGDKANQGVLLNLEAILPLLVNEDNQKVIEYIPIVALGKRLSAWAVQQTYNKIIENLKPQSSFSQDFGGTLFHYIKTIGANAVRIYKETPGLLTEESTIGNIEGKLILYKSDVEQLTYRLENHTQQQVREQTFGEGRITLLDHAGIFTIDPNFGQSILNQVSDFQGNISVGSLVTEEVKLYIITTSDKILDRQLSAIQLANEMAEKLEGNYLVLGLHFRTDNASKDYFKTLEQFKDAIDDQAYQLIAPIQAATVMSRKMRINLIDKRIENGNGLYKHRETGQLVILSDQIFNTNGEDIYQRDIYGYYISPYEYVSFGAHRVIFTDKIIPNHTSVDWLAIAFMAQQGDNLKNWLKANEDVAAGWVLDIAFTAATGGAYAIGKTVLQVGAKVTKGAVIDVAMQVAIIMVFDPSKTFEQALDEVDYGAAMYSGVEDFIKDWKATAAMACLREALVEGTQSKKEGVELIKEISLGCARNVLGQLVFKELPKKLKKTLVKYATENLESFVGNLKNIKPELTDDDVVKVLRLIGALEDVKANTFTSPLGLKYFKVVKWGADVFHNGKSAREFWEKGGTQFKHFIKDGYYVKHDPVSGDILVGKFEGDQGEILAFFNHADNKVDNLDYDDAITQAKVLKNYAEQVINSLAKAEADLKKLLTNPNEHAFKIDFEGGTKGPAIGQGGQVDLSTLGPFKAGDIVSHTHPAGTSFSVEDVFNLSALDISELRAVTNNKIYSIKKVGSFNYYTWRDKYDALVKEFQAKYSEKIKQGLTFDEKVLIQEELFLKSFEGTNVVFSIF